MSLETDLRDAIAARGKEGVTIDRSNGIGRGAIEALGLQNVNADDCSVAITQLCMGHEVDGYPFGEQKVKVQGSQGFVFEVPRFFKMIARRD